MAETHVPASVEVLREHGPLNLREIARFTAAALDANMQYEHVNSVLRVARDNGQVALIGSGGDYRNNIWKSLLPSRRTGTDRPLTPEAFPGTMPADGR